MSTSTISGSDDNYYDDDAFEERHPDDVVILQQWFRKGMLSRSAKSMINHTARVLGGWEPSDIVVGPPSIRHDHAWR